MSGAPPPRAAFETILFDLDGTVVDSVDLIRESHRHAVRTVLGRELPDDVLVANVGRPLLEQMEAFSPERAQELFDVYRAWNHAHTDKLIRAYDGIDELLHDCAAAGCALGVVTSKSGPVVELAWTVLGGMRERFGVVIAAEDSALHKPDPEPVLLALERLGGDPARSCFVGDAPFDIRAGRAAGVTTIAVTWGFFSRAVLEAERPDLIVETAGDLRRACLEGV